MNAHNEQQGFTAGDIADQGARQFAAGYAAAKAEQHVIEQIAQQWDGCMYDTVGETINIGEAIRAAGKRLSSQPAAAPGIDPHALGLLEVLGAKNFAEASNIVGELLASTPAAPGIDLRQFREAVVAWSDAAYTHSEDSDHPICREADRLLALIDGSPKATTFRNYGDSEAQFHRRRSPSELPGTRRKRARRGQPQGRQRGAECGRCRADSGRASSLDVHRRTEPDAGARGGSTDADRRHRRRDAGAGSRCR